jgi:ribosomal protein S18 acetylase RimI-like enzyme
MTPTIRRAALADAPALAELAARTFRDTFGAHNTPEDMALHLAASYGPALQAREIADPARITLVADHAGALVAFAQLRRGPAPPCVTGPTPMEIQRFYLAADWHGRGLAHSLMEHAFEVARADGAATIWLGVWERNPRAIAFYRKFGYTDVGEQTFVLGTDRQTDRVLTRALSLGGSA